MLESLGLKSLSVLLLILLIPAICIGLALGLMHEISRTFDRT